MPPAPTRQDTYLITCAIDGRDLGVFDTKSGGELDSEEAKYKPGGMVGEISLGGSRTFGNLTITRYCDFVRDWPVLKWLGSVAGAARGAVGITPLTPAGERAGEPLVYSGTLKTTTPPDIDSTGGDAAMLTLEFTIDGVA